MFFRAVKPSAAREWRKSSQPGVTTDRSVKVRNTNELHLSNILYIQMEKKALCEGKKTLAGVPTLFQLGSYF